MSHSSTRRIDKQLVAMRFSGSRGTYGSEASVQLQIAGKMMRLLTEALIAEGVARNDVPTYFRNIVEFGCGTGAYSRILLRELRPQTMLLNDLCREMEECVGDLCSHNPCIRFLPGDAEELDFPEGTDLITSCSALQWFDSPRDFFTKCHRALPPNGMLAFSTFGTENMREIRHLTGQGLDYAPIEELQAFLESGFDILHAGEEIVKLSFPHPMEVLRHLKQTGVTGAGNVTWTRGKLFDFCERYIGDFSVPGGVFLSYHPIYIIAKRKDKSL